VISLVKAFVDKNRLNDRTCILDLGPISIISPPAALSWAAATCFGSKLNFLWSSLSDADAPNGFRSPAQDGETRNFGKTSFITCSNGVAIRHGGGGDDEVVRPYRDLLCCELR
jgi:hypothetical protein